jgi:hypothetical protein
MKAKFTQRAKTLINTAMRTNSKQVRDQIKQLILECVTDENENEYTNLKDACNCLYNHFERVANHPNNMKRIPNHQERFQDYMMGLPFSFPFSNYDVEMYLNSLGINPNNKEFDPEKSLKLYYYLIYSEVTKNK